MPVLTNVIFQPVNTLHGAQRQSLGRHGHVQLQFHIRIRFGERLRVEAYHGELNSEVDFTNETQDFLLAFIRKHHLPEFTLPRFFLQFLP